MSLQLPRREELVIAPEKLHGYLLSTAHPVGRSKAAFFVGVLGFRPTRWNELESALRWHASAEVSSVVPTAFGTKFVIRASLLGPSGRAAQVRSIWFVAQSGGAPVFVTAYPEAQT